MRHSLNEIEVSCRKAAVGAGIPVGLGEDIGKAAAWLSARGFDGAGAAVNSIKAGMRLAAGEIGTDVVTFNAARAAIDGPTAMDFLLAKVAPSVVLTDVDAPLLIIGLAGVAAAESDVCIDVEVDGVHHVALVPDGLASVIGSEIGGSLRLSLTNRVAKAVDNPSTSGIEVSKDAWDLISELAQKTYVPETEASRLAGAGAGLTDND